jgi:hypothetical protein
MKYKVTKEQYTSFVNSLIKVFFGNVRTAKSPTFDRMELLIDDEEIGWIASGINPDLSDNCKFELIIYTDTLNKIKNFAPLFRKKLFAKLMIAHFSKLLGMDIDCFWIDEGPGYGEEEIFTHRIKNKKKKKKK